MCPMGVRCVGQLGGATVVDEGSTDKGQGGWMCGALKSPRCPFMGQEAPLWAAAVQREGGTSDVDKETCG